MPNKKITAMPSLAGNQVPTDLLTAVDLSAAPVNQNVKSTLNDLFATITKNITDRAIRFQAPGSAPAVSAASQGALYHNGTSFQASSNGGAYEQVFTLAAQTAALVFAGPATGGPAVPTFRALALTDLPQIATDRLLGRVASGSGEVQEITPGAGVLTWLQTPSSANLLAAVTDETGGGLANDGLLVFNQSPTIVTPSIANIRSGSNQTALRLTGTGPNHFVEIVNATQPTGPTIQPAGTNTNIPLLIKGKGTGAVEITASAVQAVGVTSGGNTNPGILEARGGNQQFGGGKLYLYERSTNGTNYVGFEAPDDLTSDLFWTLPATDGTANQALVTDGGAGLSWASFVSNSINTNRLLGRVSAGTGAVEQITPGTGVLSWLQTPVSASLVAGFASIELGNVSDTTLTRVYKGVVAVEGKKLAFVPAPNVVLRNYVAGLAWVSSTSAADNQWRAVAWAPELGLFAAVAISGTGNRVMTSPDGITWTARTSAADNSWIGIAWAPELGLFAAVATSGTGNRVMTSPDGITWTARTSAADDSWRGIAWAPELGLFAAVAFSGTGNRVMTSPDGITWTARTSAADNDWHAIAWAPELGLFAAVSNTGTGNRVMTSPDGITWTARTSAADNEWLSIAWAPELGLFAAVANSGTGNRVQTTESAYSYPYRT